jgi:signal transduction histidine kinase
LQIDYLAVFDATGRMITAPGYDVQRERSRRIPTGFAAAIRPFFTQPEAHGLLIVDGAPLLVGAAPILPTDGRGRRRGMLVMVRLLDTVRLDSLMETMQLKLSLTPRRASQGTDTGVQVIPLSPYYVTGHILLYDLAGQQALALRVTEPRTIYQWGVAGIGQQVLSTLGIGLVVCALALLLLDRLVLARLLRFHTQVQQIETAGDHAARVTDDGADEIGQLARAMNGMLAALQQAEATELARAHALLTTALDTLPFPVVILRPDCTRLYGNAAARRLLERTGGCCPFTLPLLRPITLTPMPAEEHPLARVLHGDTFLTLEAVLELDADTRMPMLLSAGGVVVDDRLEAIVLAGQDITELKNADDAKNDFLAVLSHELLTPLTSILGWTDIALATGGEATQAKALGVILRNARRQKRLVDDLLDISRLIHRKLACEPEALELGACVEQCVESQAQVARDRGVRVTCHRHPGGVPIHADPLRLQQVIGNLLHNAVKFTDPGGDVVVTVRREEAWAVLTIRDSGRGIARDALPELFTIFRQVERNEATGGLGLGLALVKGIVELHGGRVDADSPGVGHGSTFTIRLPLCEADVAREPAGV